MGWFSQARIFFKEVGAAKAREQEEEKVPVEDLEFVSSASEARLLDKPEGASFLIMLAVLCTVGILYWSVTMQIDEVAKAQGKVIPSKQIQVIQNLEGGIVKKINVIEGQNVKEGDILMEIDDVYAKSEVNQNTNTYNALLARYVALNTLISGKRILNFPDELKSYIEIMSQERQRFHAEWEKGISRIKALEFVIDQRKQEVDDAKSNLEGQLINYRLAQKELKLNEPLLKSGAISEVELLKIKQQVNTAKSKYDSAKISVPKAKAALHEAMQKRESFIQEAKENYEKERNEVQAKLNSLQQKGVSLSAKLSHSVVKSPVVGTVKKINFNTIGGVVRPGMDIMEIVPTDNELLIEVKVKPKDIGFMTVGQKAKVKITAFDFSTYGGLEGKIEFLSADTITDKKGNSFYLARIRTMKNYIVDKEKTKHIIIPGMKTEVDIIIDKKSILSYILKPMLK